MTTPNEKSSISDRSNSTLKIASDHAFLYYQSNGIKSIGDKLRGYSTSLGMYKGNGIIHHIEFISHLLSLNAVII